MAGTQAALRDKEMEEDGEDGENGEEAFTIFVKYKSIGLINGGRSSGSSGRRQ